MADQSLAGWLRRLDSAPAGLTDSAAMKVDLLRMPLSALSLVVFSCWGGGSPPPEEPIAPESWTEIAPEVQPGWLMNVHGAAHDDRYAVGGTLTDGAMLHFDGETWSPVDLGVSVPLLNWIHGDGEGRYVAVGQGGTALHYDGEAWTLMETASASALTGATAALAPA